ncbi:MAG TPA: class I SAM-dependent methyltransferase [Flavobacteriales bacterium]|nr:class I SAM-dependent methyltransferase [Flavobacteriales bacterium]
MIRFFKKRSQHQVKNSTSYNRYPEIFKATKDYFTEKGKNEITLLSYGCSTGEECFSLREYFPQAKIVGLDIDLKNIETANSRNSDPNTTFLESHAKNLRKSGPFDLIFCMSVFCRWPDSQNVDDITGLYPFSKFEEGLAELDSNLSVGGLLVLYNTSFLFRESKLYAGYEVLKSPTITESGFVHKFGKNNIKLMNQLYDECIFIKKQ